MIKAKYKIFPEQQLLVEVFYGDISMGDLQVIITEQMKNPEFSKIKRTLSDVRKANMQISNSELDS